MRLAVAVVLLLTFAFSASATGPGVSVITREMLERHHFASVARAIEMLAGMDVHRTYFKSNIVTARGILQEHYANKILILIDGVPAWNAVTGEAIVDRIDIRDVERIEVTKGPASVAFGSNAFAGAVNIILRKPAAGAIEAYAGAGTESTFDAGGLASIGNVIVSAHGRGDDGRERSIADERGVSSTYREYQRGHEFTLQLRANHHTLLFNGARETESFLGNTPDLAAGLGQDHRSRGYLTAYTYEHGRFRYRASYDWSARDFSRTGDGLTRSNVEGWRLSNGIAARFGIVDVGIDHDARKSVEYTNYDVRTGRVLENNNMRDRSVSEWSAHARAKHERDPWRLAAGARYTNNAVSGSNVSAEARVERSLGANTRVALLAGQSYRAPSMFELYFQTATNTVFGNTDLQPETSTAVQLVATHTIGNVDAQATVYRATYDDRIFRTRRLPNDPVDRSLIYVNGDRFDATGVELELRATLPRATAFASYAHVEGDDVAFRFVSPHSLSAGASSTFGALSISAVGTWRSSTDGPRAEIGARSSIDLQLGYATKAAGLSVRHVVYATNAFDSDQEVPEFVRRNLNEIPSGLGRRVGYVIEVGR